ncbi:penicillin-binding protein [Paenibacillus endoradicis]|uniref:penicillin-binding protein n=1 Tax=Paenibacillus endoradicis TaxID=2972487 RepID=UPI002159A52F|nr:penicillin-binding protein [Paenibacillus endoradicis]MCR8655996.1 penicillin-binding protein [Paenibacillus endoradicis]MCR8658322.1 penicillin-binding protein [Paenibacillus endoradicis]
MIKRIKLRTLLLGGVITLLFLFLIFHIYKVQVVEGSMWLQLAEKRWSTSETFKSKRGTITDRSGNVLAMDAIAYNVSINPKLIHGAGIEDEVSEALKTILGMPEDTVNSNVNAKRDDGTYYSNRELRKGGWQIEKEVADQLKAFSDELKKKLSMEKKAADTGIYIEETYERIYPQHKIASQLIGYISIDGENKMGVESTFNDLLTGSDGHISYQKDGQKVQIAGSDVEYVAPKNGQKIELTIDADIQGYAEEALRSVVQQYSPKSATAIVADPNTMEILAMANMPDFDPNNYGDSDYSNMYNHAVGSLYEPGSTFKIVTLAAAIEEGVFDPDELYQSGSIYVPGDPNPIRDHNRYGWGKISFLQGLKFSSNVAFVKLGFERLGGEKLKAYFNNFGFAQKTGIEIPNEAVGTIRFQYNREIAAAAFGQGGVVVTPIQQIAAVAAVANGGELMQPYIVKSKTDPTTQTTIVTEPTTVRRVISEESSKLANEYLEQVVSDRIDGTGRNAYIEGYRVAGKTGTAQKVIGNKYSSDKYVVSFIGYAPVDDPQLIVLVIVDEPNDKNAGGSKVAAPVFREIMLKSLRKLNIAPNYENIAVEEGETPTEVMITTPDVTGMKGGLAKEKLKNAGLPFEFIGDGSIVEQQIPTAGTLVHPTQTVYLVTEQKENLSIPDLTGVSLRDAVEIAALLGVQLKIEGAGYVYSQQLIEDGKSKVLNIMLSPLKESEYYVDGTLDKADKDVTDGLDETDDGAEEQSTSGE